MNKNKIIFYILWLGALSLVPISILSNTSFSEALKVPATFVNFIQRFLGLTAFTLMFFQVILGAFMDFWTEKLGGWVFKFHIMEGITIYTLIVLHPISFMVFNYFIGHGLNPFFVFVDFCILCSTKIDLYYTLGRTAFWLLNISVWAALFRTATPFMRVNWRKFHILNYLVFLIVGLHGFFLGTDFSYMPFIIFAIPAYITVLGIIIFIKLPGLFRSV
ncbi:MAG TPA: hypothetical protein VKC54_02560 [Patescibacteria group bacterium]|nr:hypothetical protein [Patescibacteria group bacterium]